VLHFHFYRKWYQNQKRYTLYMIHYTITSVTNQRDCVTLLLLKETIWESEAFYFIYDTLRNNVSDESKKVCYTFTSTGNDFRIRSVLLCIWYTTQYRQWRIKETVLHFHFYRKRHPNQKRFALYMTHYTITSVTI